MLANILLVLAIMATAGMLAWYIPKLVDSALIPIEASKLLDGRVMSEGSWERGETRLVPDCQTTPDWPQGPQVYAHFDPKGRCVYVGQAVNLRQRFQDHAHSERAFKHEWTTWQSWACEARELNYVERSLIRLWKPIGNVQKYTSVIPERPEPA